MGYQWGPSYEPRPWPCERNPEGVGPALVSTWPSRCVISGAFPWAEASYSYFFLLRGGTFRGPMTRCPGQPLAGCDKLAWTCNEGPVVVRCNERQVVIRCNERLMGRLGGPVNVSFRWS